MTFGPWRICTKYPDEVSWEYEFVPQTETVIFRNWSDVMAWFRLLESDLRHASVQIKIVPLPVEDANVPASPTTVSHYLPITTTLHAGSANRET